MTLTDLQLGTALGALVGTISLLFKMLLASKSSELAALQKENDRLRAERDANAIKVDELRDIIIKQSLARRPSTTRGESPI